MSQDHTTNIGAGAPGVAVIGTGYVGTVAAVAFATVGWRVVGIESDPDKLAALSSGKVPFHEPGLDTMLGDVVSSGALRFTDDLAAGVAGADVVFICVGTPPDDDGRPDLTALRGASRAVAEAATGRTVVITKSTVPIGWGAELRRLIAGVGSTAETGGDVQSRIPTRRVGRQGLPLPGPDRARRRGPTPSSSLVTELYRPILEQSFPGGRPELEPVLVRTDTATAETIKYAANGFLATKIAFINEIARICDEIGADVLTVADAMGLDHRIERRFLGAGIGYGGSCFSKDLDALIWFGEDQGIELPILESVNPSNQVQRSTVLDKLRSGLGDLDGKRIALLGLAYKSNTDDLRDAPALTIAASAVDDGARVVGYDPVVSRPPGSSRGGDRRRRIRGRDRCGRRRAGDRVVRVRRPRPRGVAESMAGDLVSTVATGSTRSRSPPPASATSAWAAAVRRLI